jgi:hypothetical protein
MGVVRPPPGLIGVVSATPILAKGVAESPPEFIYIYIYIYIYKSLK